ncbi:MAG TPA: HEAT repeat domain-containing protein [Gemmatimonadaceae bacterium]
MTGTDQVVHEDEIPEPPFDTSVVIDAMRMFAKAVRAHQLYQPNNPMHARALDAAREAFFALWDHTDSITLLVTDSDFRWFARPVLEEPGRGSDSLPWMFFKDGIREVSIQRDFETSELLILLGMIQRARRASGDDDDLLTLLWEYDFNSLQYRYVDVSLTAGTTVEPIPRHEMPEKITAPRVAEAAGEELLSSTSVARMEEYDSTLYFLDDGEIEYLNHEIKRDFASDLRSQVIASLLDTFELETDPTVREEIIGILDGLFLSLLSLTQFRTAAYLIREASITAARARGLVDPQRQRLVELADRLSEPEALEQLLHALEDTPLRPPQNDLNELFMQLRPRALERVLGWIARTRNSELRALLENAGSRLAASHTAQLVRLIGSEDDVVAFEAIRRSGALRATAAVPTLAKAIGHAGTELRLAAVTALAEIGSAGALQVLETALSDSDQDVRMATVRALATHRHGAAAIRIQELLRSKELRESTLSEKMAFFEAYGELCGEEGVSFLDGILNSRGFLGRRDNSELRACAAMALGKVGSYRAIESLQRAGADGDPLVRNAVSRAVRGG